MAAGEHSDGPPPLRGQPYGGGDVLRSPALPGPGTVVPGSESTGGGPGSALLAGRAGRFPQRDLP